MTSAANGQRPSTGRVPTIGILVPCSVSLHFRPLSSTRPSAFHLVLGFWQGLASDRGPSPSVRLRLELQLPSPAVHVLLAAMAIAGE